MDGTNATFWVGAVEEIKTAFTGKFNETRMNLGGPPTSGQQHYYSGLIMAVSDSEADRIDHTDIEILTIAEDGDWATEQGYGDNADCSGTAAVAADVALSGSDAVDTSIYWCILGGNAGKQMNETTTVTIPAGGRDILGLHFAAVQNAFVAAKVVATFARLHDGTSSIEVELLNVAGTNFAHNAVVFTTAPDGSAFDQTDIDNLKHGIRSLSSNASNDRCAAIILEIVACSADPPPSDRRRAMGSVS